MSHSPRVLSLVWNLIRGGTEGQCARVAMALAARGHTHRVGVFRRDGFFLAAVEQACGPVALLDIHHALAFSTFRQVHQLGRWIREEQIELLHAWDADADIFGAWVAHRVRVPLITSHRDLGEIYPAWKTHLMDRADRHAVRVVVNADAIRADLVRRGLPSGRIETIPNMLDLHEFDKRAAEASGRWHALPPGRLVGMVARLDPEKDAATFIRAAAVLAKARPDTRFIVAGDGVERPLLEALATELGVGDRVHYLGDVEDVPALVHRFEVGVLVPNANEGLSNTVMEYMAAAKPSVVTDCGGNRELIIDGENGYVIPMGDHQALADRIKRLLDNRDRAARMGRAGRNRIEQNHMPAVVASRFAGLYEDAVQAEIR